MFLHLSAHSIIYLPVSQHAAHSSGVSGFSNFRHPSPRPAGRGGPAPASFFIRLRLRALSPIYTCFPICLCAPSITLCGLIVESLISGDNYTVRWVGRTHGRRSFDAPSVSSPYCVSIHPLFQQQRGARCGRDRRPDTRPVQTLWILYIYTARSSSPASIELEKRPRIALPGRDPALKNGRQPAITKG